MDRLPAMLPYTFQDTHTHSVRSLYSPPGCRGVGDGRGTSARRVRTRMTPATKDVRRVSFSPRKIKTILRY